MTGFLLRLLVSAGAVLLAATIFGQYVEVRGLREGQAAGLTDALLFAFVLGLLNALVRPVLLLLTCPINLLTLGLFVFVVNAAVFALATWFVPSVQVNGFLGALIGSLVVSVCSAVANRFLE